MGGFISKISPDSGFDRGFNESFTRIKNTFDRTPRYRIINDKTIDPRSATFEINRTPLCLLDLAEEEGSTPVTRNKKKSKRKSLSRLSDNDSNRSDITSRSFEFSSVSYENYDSNYQLWEPRVEKTNEIEQIDVVKDETKEITDQKYEIVVEELRECLSKTTVTPIYVDKDSPNKNIKVATPPVNKDLKKKIFWTPDNAIATKSPLNKERTPLGLINNNSQTMTSSSFWRGGKIWRVPAEERAKLQEKNTPSPNFPRFGSPKSCPPANRHIHYQLK